MRSVAPVAVVAFVASSWNALGVVVVSTMDRSKKISFCFAKSKSVPAKVKNVVNDDVQFIECIESNSIKIKGAVNVEELTIPVRKDKLMKDTTLSKILGMPNLNKNDYNRVPNDTRDSKPCHSNDPLEAIAVEELLEDSKNVREAANNDMLILQPRNVPVSDVESTIEDYDDVPVSQFGLAMLRGMGWKPDKGIGKNEKVVNPTQPVLRPKGVGLGAEKRQIASVSSSKSEHQLKKGSYVLILTGSNKNTYGQVQSFDEDAGRVIIKAALGGTNVTVNESMIQVVSMCDYEKSSRVLNLSKYEECKSREEKYDRKYSKNFFENKRLKRCD